MVAAHYYEAELPNFAGRYVVSTSRSPPGPGEGRSALTVAGPSGTEVRVKPPHLSVFHPDDLSIVAARV